MEVKSQGSVFNANKFSFYGQENPVGFKIEAAKGQTNSGPQVNTKSGVFKKDAATFYGAEKYEVESQGTQFQQNAAAFMGIEKPVSGERPFKIDKNAKAEDTNKGRSYLNEARLQEHVS